MVSTRSSNKTSHPGGVVKPPPRRSTEEVAAEKLAKQNLRESALSSKAARLARLAELEREMLSLQSSVSSATAVESESSGDNTTGTPTPVILKIKIGHRSGQLAVDTEETNTHTVKPQPQPPALVTSKKGKEKMGKRSANLKVQAEVEDYDDNIIATPSSPAPRSARNLAKAVAGEEDDDDPILPFSSSVSPESPPPEIGATGSRRTANKTRKGSVKAASEGKEKILAVGASKVKAPPKGKGKATASKTKVPSKVKAPVPPKTKALGRPKIKNLTKSQTNTNKVQNMAKPLAPAGSELNESCGEADVDMDDNGDIGSDGDGAKARENPAMPNATRTKAAEREVDSESAALNEGEEQMDVDVDAGVEALVRANVSWLHISDPICAVYTWK